MRSGMTEILEFLPSIAHVHYMTWHFVINYIIYYELNVRAPRWLPPDERRRRRGTRTVCAHVEHGFCMENRIRERKKRRHCALVRAAPLLIFMTNARVHACYHERVRGIFCLRRIRPLTKPDDAWLLKVRRASNETARAGITKNACRYAWRGRRHSSLSNKEKAGLRRFRAAFRHPWTALFANKKAHVIHTRWKCSFKSSFRPI